MRVVFDVSVLIRFVMGSSLVAGLIRRAVSGEYVILSTELLAEELATTAAKPRLQGLIDRIACEDLLNYLRGAAEQVHIRQPFPPCRDPDDAYLLALARDGAADVLVTNDDDLLVQKVIGSCEILTPEAFAQRLTAGDRGH